MKKPQPIRYFLAYKCGEMAGNTEILADKAIRSMLDILAIQEHLKKLNEEKGMPRDVCQNLIITSWQRFETEEAESAIITNKN